MMRDLWKNVHKGSELMNKRRKEETAQIEVKSKSERNLFGCIKKEEEEISWKGGL